MFTPNVPTNECNTALYLSASGTNYGAPQLSCDGISVGLRDVIYEGDGVYAAEYNVYSNGTLLEGATVDSSYSVNVTVNSNQIINIKNLNSYPIPSGALSQSYGSSDTELNLISAPVKSNPLSVSLSPLQETITPGQLVNIKATVSGGTGEYTYQWYSGSSSTCSEDTVFGSSMTTVSNSQDFAVYPNSTTSYCLEVQSPGAATIYSQMVTITVNSNSVTSNSLQNYVFLTNTGSSGAYTPMV